MMYQQEMQKWSLDVLWSVGAKGPTPEQYSMVDIACRWVYAHMDLTEARNAMKKFVIEPHQAFQRIHFLTNLDVMLHIWDKPRGYAGDASLLEKLYRGVDSPIHHQQSNWDRYILSKPEILSLQSRKEMFSDIVVDLYSKGVRSLLDIGCGVGEFTGTLRQMYTLEEFCPIVGVDMDSEAIAQAQKNFPENRYFVSNALIGYLPGGCDMVFSGGLFDYFNDRVFTLMLKKIKKLNPMYILIGNIAQGHITRPMMSLLGWDLYDRERFDLACLAVPVFQGAQIHTLTDRTGCQNWLFIDRSKLV